MRGEVGCGETEEVDGKFKVILQDSAWRERVRNREFCSLSINGRFSALAKVNKPKLFRNNLKITFKLTKNPTAVIFLQALTRYALAFAPGKILSEL